MTYSIWLTWLLRVIIAFVLVTIKIKDHIYYSSELESNLKNILSEWNLSLGRWVVKECYRQINKGLAFQMFLVLQSENFLIGEM